MVRHLSWAIMLAASDHWTDLKRDAATGIETLRAHFTGHAYDPHDHDEMAVGVTEQGVQTFRCRKRLNASTPGHAVLIEPGETHDGEALDAAGFTYAMVYLPTGWLAAETQVLAAHRATPGEIGFRETVSEDTRVARSIARAFRMLHDQEARLARDAALTNLVGALAGHAAQVTTRRTPRPHPVARRARDALSRHMSDDIGLDQLAALAGADRFRLTRLFREAYERSPHAYLIQLRLKTARRRLAAGDSPAQTAAACGFSDQSHLGRWFRRAYGMTPAAYRRICTNLPD
jgi:AraC-like DNA-binding protein